MARTYRNLPHGHWNRRPKYRHKLLAGIDPKYYATDRDDKPVAARKETR